MYWAYMIGLSLPLCLHPTLVVGHLDPAVRHLSDAQQLEHQDPKRPYITPETQFPVNRPVYRFVLVSKNPHRLVNSRMNSASGAVHLIGSFSFIVLILLGGRANPKSATFGQT